MFRCYSNEWEEYIIHCGFTDDELEIIKFMRKEWVQSDIAAELCIFSFHLKTAYKTHLFKDYKLYL